MWRIGFFFHEMAFGLLSILLPLYVIAIGGSLVDIGIMSATALLLVIPASFFWGYLCDKTRHYKRYILLSFLTSTFLLYLFTIATNVGFLIILYVVMSMLHVAHEPPKNILIAELYSRKDWERAFALYEGFTEIGWLIGLLLGVLASTYGLGVNHTLLLCSALNFVAFGVSVIVIEDPILIFERGLVSIEKAIDFAFKGVVIASQLLDGMPQNGRLKRENPRIFCIGLILFSTATSMLFRPLPIFLSQTLPTNAVFAMYMLNSAGGAIGYFLASNRSRQIRERPHIEWPIIFRSILALLLIAVAQPFTYSGTLAAAILFLMGFAYALFLVYTLSLSMELIPARKAGLFNVFLGIGGASGSFIGPFLAQTLNFTFVFLVSSLVFFLAFIAFKLF